MWLIYIAGQVMLIANNENSMVESGMRGPCILASSPDAAGVVNNCTNKSREGKKCLNRTHYHILLHHEALFSTLR